MCNTDGDSRHLRDFLQPFKSFLPILTEKRRPFWSWLKLRGTGETESRGFWWCHFDTDRWCVSTWRQTAARTKQVWVTAFRSCALIHRSICLSARHPPPLKGWAPANYALLSHICETALKRNVHASSCAPLSDSESSIAPHSVFNAAQLSTLHFHQLHLQLTLWNILSSASLLLLVCSA